MNLCEKIRPSFMLSDAYNECARYVDNNGLETQNQTSRIYIDTITELLSRNI